MSALSQEQISEANRLRALDKRFYNYKTLRQLFDVSDETVRRAIDPVWARERRDRTNENRRKRFPKRELTSSVLERGGRVSQEEFEEQRRKIPPDTRDLTARFFGDPLPGRSALDMRSPLDGR